MATPKVTQESAVWQAIDEYDQVGGRAFHEKYGFGPADEYLLSARGRLYDSKAILAVAQGYEDEGLGPAGNGEFSGGVPVRHRLEGLGFDVIVDRRCGDFLKLLPAIRTASDRGSERVYKPLLLLVAIGRAASGQPRVAPFDVYGGSLEALLEQFAAGHGDAAFENAWWRLPGDGLWEVRSGSSQLVRAAGDRARTSPPAQSELRSQSGGLPERFYDALREVAALPATAANVLLERFFPDLAPDERQSLISLAVGNGAGTVADLDIHLVVKWSPRYAPDTIAKHQEVVEQHGAVWWALFRQGEEPRQVAQRWVDQLRVQIEAGRDTFVFVSGETCWRTRLHEVETDIEQVDPELIPTYYAQVPGQKVLWLKLSRFESMTRNDLLRELDPVNNPGKAVALGGQANPLMVRFRSRPRVWWVYQGESYRRAREGGYLWAPQRNQAGRTERHHEALLFARSGDAVVN